MKLKVLLKDVDEVNEQLERLGITTNDSEDKYFFADTYVHEKTIDILYVINHSKFGKIMLVYLLGEENPMTCLYDEEIIKKVYGEL